MPDDIDAALALEEAESGTSIPIPWVFQEAGTWFSVPRLPILLAAGDAAKPPFHITGILGSG